MTETFLAEAAALGDGLAALAVHSGRRCTWFARALPGLERLVAPRATTLDATVYSGTAGVAIFLARLARWTTDRAHESAARASSRHALAGARGALREGAAMGRERVHSAYTGALGVAWGACEVADTLGDAELRQEAMALARSLLGRPRRGTERDIMLGRASGIPLLLDLEERGLQGARDVAESLGRDLAREATPAGDRLSWPPPRATGVREHPLGFSHGAAGIGWALAVLHDATGETRFREAALAAFRYEDSLFDAAAGNWPNFLDPRGPRDKPRFWTTWCHGAPGIGLSRALSAPLLSAPYLLDAARRANATTEAELRHRLERPGSEQTPCCGVAGVAECLDLTERALGVPDAGALSRRVGRASVERFGAPARRRWGPDTGWPTSVPAGAHPSLMKGLAGIGHYLLRLHAPDKVPSALVPGAAMRV